MPSDLYEKLGGRDALEAVVDEFYERVLADDQLRGFFEDSDMDDLRAHQVLFLGSLAGGNMEYDGQSMAEAHADLDISDDDFDAVAVHLKESLEAFDVDPDATEAVVEAVADYRDDVVTA